MPMPISNRDRKSGRAGRADNCADRLEPRVLFSTYVTLSAQGSFPLQVVSGSSVTVTADVRQLDNGTQVNADPTGAVTFFYYNTPGAAGRVLGTASNFTVVTQYLDSQVTVTFTLSPPFGDGYPDSFGDDLILAAYGGDANVPAGSSYSQGGGEVGNGGPSVRVSPDGQFIPVDFVSTSSSLSVTGQASTTAAGEKINPGVQVSVLDSSGNVNTASAASITASLASSSTGTGTLGGTTTVSAVNGVATFANLTVSKAGQYTLSFTDADDGTTNSTPFDVTGGKLAFVEQPTDGDVGAPLKPFTVAVENSKGKVDTTDNSTVVTLAAVPASGASPALTGNTATVVRGIATFKGLTVAAPGTFTLSADDGGDTDATSASFKIVGDHLVFQKQPAADGDIKAPILFSVEALDAKNHVVTTLDGDVAVSLNVVDGGDGATLGGDTTIQLVGGKAVYTVADDDTLAVAGDYTLTASYVAAATPALSRSADVVRPAVTADEFVTSANSNKFKLDPFQLVFFKGSLPEKNSVFGAIPFIVLVWDHDKRRVDFEDGNYVAVTDVAQITDGAHVPFTFGSGAAVIQDGIARVTTTGDRTFTIDAPGAYTALVTEDSALGTSPATDTAVTTTLPQASKTFSVEPLKLLYVGFPRLVDVDQPFKFQVGVTDFNRKLVDTQDGNQIDITEVAQLIGSGPSGGNANFGSTVISGGIATFSDISIDTRGTYHFVFQEVLPPASPDDSPVYVTYTTPTTTRTFTVLTG